MLLAQSTYWLTEVAGLELAAMLGSGWMRFWLAISAEWAAATAFRRRSTSSAGRPLRARSWLIRDTSRLAPSGWTGAATGRLAVAGFALDGRMRPGPAVTTSNRLMISGMAMAIATSPRPRPPSRRGPPPVSVEEATRDVRGSLVALDVDRTPHPWLGGPSALQSWLGGDSMPLGRFGEIGVPQLWGGSGSPARPWLEEVAPLCWPVAGSACHGRLGSGVAPLPWPAAG